jgi:hypothetical protein
MTRPARVSASVSVGVSSGVSAGVLDTSAETPTLGTPTVQVSGEMYLLPSDPTHGIHHAPSNTHEQ